MVVVSASKHHLHPVPLVRHLPFQFSLNITATSPQDWTNVSAIHPPSSPQIVGKYHQQPNLFVQHQLYHHYQNYIHQQYHQQNDGSRSKYYQQHYHNVSTNGISPKKVDNSNKQQIINVSLSVVPSHNTSKSNWQYRDCGTASEASKTYKLVAKLPTMPREGKTDSRPRFDVLILARNPESRVNNILTKEQYGHKKVQHGGKVSDRAHQQTIKPRFDFANLPRCVSGENEARCNQAADRTVRVVSHVLPAVHSVRCPVTGEVFSCAVEKKTLLPTQQRLQMTESAHPGHRGSLGSSGPAGAPGQAGPCRSPGGRCRDGSPEAQSDCVHSSVKEILTELQVCEWIDQTPTSVVVEKPKIYIDYPGQEICHSLVIQEHSHCGAAFTHTGEKPYKCDDCGVSFTEILNLKRHKRTHTGEKTYKCDDCGAAFTAAGSLKCHKRTHTGEKPYKCDDCGAAFNHASNLKQHKRTHTGEKPYKCDDCGAAFTEAGSLKRHKRMHTGEKPYKCDDCGAAFNCASTLKHHKRAHTGEKPYKCDDCGAAFTSAGSLKCHKRAHTGEKPYKCDDCGAAFTSADRLKCHKITHTGEKPYKCNDCGAAFIRASTLKQHKRTHKGEKPYKCDYCGAAFIEAGNLKSHKRTHTGEKPYKCDDCGAAFSETGNLKRHKRTHTGEKPYKCDDCCAAFYEARSLKCHKRTHTGEKLYKCDHCGASLTNIGRLYHHMRRHTGEKP